MKWVISSLIVFAFVLARTDAAAEDWCANDQLCEQVAVGVAKQHIAERIDNELTARSGGAALCPESDPDCCPEEFRHVCAQAADRSIAGARHDFETNTASAFASAKCPFAGPLCDVMNTWCERDERWTPWGGCNKIPELVDPGCPPGSTLSSDGCKPWEPCPCGYKHNSKGKCIPKTCYKGGAQIPCVLACEIPSDLSLGLLSRDSGSAPATPLARQLYRPEVQIRALREYKRELEDRIKLIDREMKEYKQAR